MGNLTGSRVFLDAVGNAPMSPRTREALASAADEGWADPERRHAESRRARALLDGARQSVAAVLGAPTEHTFFVPTFGLAFDRALAGIAAARRGRATIVASAIDRKPMLRIARRVAEKVALVPVDAAGFIDLDAFANAVAGPDVALAVAQHGNQEIGTLQDVEDLHAAAVEAKVPLLVDATASVGHVDVPAHWDALAAHAADWGGPPGIAVLAFRPGTRRAPVPPNVIDKVSVPAALAAAVALEEREEHRAEVGPRLAGHVARIRAVASAIPDTLVLGDPGASLPHVLTFACRGADGEALAAELDRRGFAVGSGSACTTEESEESHVLAALGAPARANVRVTLHPALTDDGVARFLDALPEAVEEVRAMSPRP